MQERGIYSLIDGCNETEEAACSCSARDNVQNVGEASDVHSGGLCHVYS